MSIFAVADETSMSQEALDPLVMQLLADGVPLELLVDIAMAPAGSSGSPPDAENPGYYWL